MYTVEYYSAIKKNEIMSFVAIRMELEIVTVKSGNGFVTDLVIFLRSLGVFEQVTSLKLLKHCSTILRQ